MNKQVRKTEDVPLQSSHKKKKRGGQSTHINHRFLVWNRFLKSTSRCRKESKEQCRHSENFHVAGFSMNQHIWQKAVDPLIYWGPVSGQVHQLELHYIHMGFTFSFGE